MSVETVPAIGLAFKPVHFESALADMAAVDFFEVHAENYLGAGGLPHRQLQRLRSERPLFVHGVGLSLGGSERPDRLHLQRLAGLLARHEAAVFSEHLAWSSHAARYLPDLLPLDYDDAALVRLCAHVDEAQQVLGRTLLIENPSRYLPAADPLAEPQFLEALQRATGCGLLLDLNNVVVSCHNQGIAPRDYLRRFPLQAVAQFHLAGHRRQSLADGSTILIDDHAGAIGELVLDLYAEALAITGPVPTLIEWDQDLPDWNVLTREAERARAATQRVRTTPGPGAAA
ncbi:MAG: DUF692 domain-containing protein [Rhodanobacteraceae bacterium]|nr:DUF692 domain-containing protein [Rhodanobacteraceae bacterium]